MKKIMSIFLAFFAITSQAAEIKNYEEAVNAVDSGQTLRFVFHINECQAEVPFPKMTISLKPNAVMVLNNKITASDRHFTMDAPMNKGTAVYGYKKINLYSDGQVLLRIDLMEADGYGLLSQYSLRCILGKSMKLYH